MQPAPPEQTAVVHSNLILLGGREHVFRIVVTADQSQEPNKEGTDLQTRRPMGTPL